MVAPTLPATDVLSSLSGPEQTSQLSTLTQNTSQDARQDRGQACLPAATGIQGTHSPSRSCQGHHDLRPQRRVLVLGGGDRAAERPTGEGGGTRDLRPSLGR